MNKLLIATFALLAACMVNVAASFAAAPAPRPSAAPPDRGRLHAAIPMVYKQYGRLGVKSAWDAQRSTTVIIQNVAKSSDANPFICFYRSVAPFPARDPQDFEKCYIVPPIRSGESYPVQLDALAEMPGSFAGSALIWSDMQVTAVAAQHFSEDETFRGIGVATAVRPFAAADQAYVPTFYADEAGHLSTHAVSALFVQNVDDQTNTVIVEFVPAIPMPDQVPLIKTVDLSPGRALLLEAPTVFTSDSGGTRHQVDFNGSAVVSAGRADGTRGLVAAHVFELARGSDPNTTYNLAKAYVGFARGSQALNMPTALCEAFGSPLSKPQSTAYAIQNVGERDAEVKVTYQPGAYVAWINLHPGEKGSLQTCTTAPKNFSGSALIETDMEIVAIGKAFPIQQLAGTGSITAFEGVEQGAEALSIPYISWPTEADYQAHKGARANIALQNTGSAQLKSVGVWYHDTNNHADVIELGPIDAGAKVNTNVSQLSAQMQANIAASGLGSVNIIGGAGSSLSAVVRVQQRVAGGSVSEDYVAIPTNDLQFRCECDVSLPEQSQLSPTVYFRQRIQQQVTAACAEGVSGRDTPQLSATVTVGQCSDCANACKKRFAAKFYQTVSTSPALGAAGDAQAKLDDTRDLAAKDPCQVQSSPLFIHRAVCRP